MTDLSSIKIGGRNYILQSDKYITTQGGHLFNFVDFKQYRGKTITVSVDIELVNGRSSGHPYERIGTEPAFRFADGSELYCGCWHRLGEGTNFKGRKSITFDIPDKEIVEVIQDGIYIQLDGDVTKVGRPQIEIGNVVTDWKPAPEDFAISSNLEEKILQIYDVISSLSGEMLSKDRIFVQSSAPSSPRKGDIFIKTA